MTNEIQRKRKTLAEIIRKHSPMKQNTTLKVANEDAHLDMCSKILPGLWIGNYKCAKNKDFFVKNKIKAVLNCTEDLPNSFMCSKNVEYMRIPVNDSLKEKDFKKMLDYFPVIVEFLYKHVVIEKHNVLVHCWAGRQRSAISVAAFLVKYFNMTPRKAIKYIISQRPEAFHFGKSINFDQSLDKYYRSLKR
jgi:protein-tyrosine phosphatase